MINVIMLGSVKTLFQASARSTPGAAGSQTQEAGRKRLRRRIGQMLDFVTTEYNFRFKRQAIREQLAAVRHLPRNLHIEATNTCNAACTFCAYPQMERAKETMPMDRFCRLVDEYIGMGGKYVSLTPIVGDPFVDRDLFARLDYLHARPEIQGFDFYTNGILMKPHVSEKLLKYGDKLQVFVSFGGFDRDTYKAIMGVDYFDLVCRNIAGMIAAKQAANSQMPFILALRCPEANWHGPFWDACNADKADGWLDIHYVKTFDSWAGKVPEAALRQVGLEPVLPPHKRGACELLFMKPVILANGQVNACACRDVEAELIVGDTATMSLADIWSGNEIEALIDRHERGDFPTVCQRCTWYISIYNTRKRQMRINSKALALNDDN